MEITYSAMKSLASRYGWAIFKISEEQKYQGQEIFFPKCAPESCLFILNSSWQVGGGDERDCKINECFSLYCRQVVNDATWQDPIWVINFYSQIHSWNKYNKIGGIRQELPVFELTAVPLRRKAVFYPFCFDHGFLLILGKETFFVSFFKEVGSGFWKSLIRRFR